MSTRLALAAMKMKAAAGRREPAFTGKVSDQGTPRARNAAMTRPNRINWALLAAAASVASCTGQIGDPPGVGTGTAQGAQCGKVMPGPAPIRRMTRFEYNSTIRELLNDSSDLANEFVIEEESLGFNNQATAMGVTQLLAEQYMEASETLALN